MNTASLPVPPSKAAARAAIALSGALLLGFILVWLAADGRGIGRSDFTAFYVGGTLLREGHTADLYDESAQMPLHARLIVPDREGNLPYVDSPVAAAIVLPVTFLPLHAAYRVWSLAVLVVLALAVLVAVRSAPWPDETPRVWKIAAGAMALASLGTWAMLLQAQWTPLLALGLALAFRAWRRQQHARGAFLLVIAAAIAKPHLALALIAFMLGWRERRVIVGALAGGAALAASAFAVVGGAGIAGFIGIVAGSTTRWDLRTMVSFVGLPGSLLGNVFAAHVAGAAGTLLACALAFLLGATVRRHPARLTTCVCGAAVLSLLAAPHALPHDLVMLAPAVVWGVALAMRDAPARARRQAVMRRVAVIAGLWGLISVAAFIDFAGNSAVPPGQLSAWALGAAAALACVHAWRRTSLRRPAAQLSFSARAT